MSDRQLVRNPLALQHDRAPILLELMDAHQFSARQT
jgi:hypothetical protein